MLQLARTYRFLLGTICQKNNPLFKKELDFIKGKPPLYDSQ